MSTSSIPPSLPPHNLAGRKKGPKNLPKLPPSAFSPPPTGTSEAFPLPVSPSTHPEAVIDAHVTIPADRPLDQWKEEVGGVYGGRIASVVINAREHDLDNFIHELEEHSKSPLVLSLTIPFDLDGPEQNFPSTKLPISFSTIYTGPSAAGSARLRHVLKLGRPVEIFVQDLRTDADLEGLEEFLAKSTTDLSNLPPIIISNFVPPPHDSTLPIVKLMNHPIYQAFQGQVAALALYEYISVKFLPPSWVSAPEGEEEDIIKQKRDWKRRIKMYLAPIVEAFGFQRIIFGSSPSPTTTSSTLARDWYELARESLAELGVEQDVVDAVFHDNAKRVYGS